MCRGRPTWAWAPGKSPPAPRQRAGHNINFVMPEHVVPQILGALPAVIDAGLRPPVVCNTSCYDSLDSLALMDGIAGIYLPGLNVWTPGGRGCLRIARPGAVRSQRGSRSGDSA